MASLLIMIKCLRLLFFPFSGVGATPMDCSEPNARIFRPGFEPSASLFSGFQQPATPEEEQKMTRSKMEQLRKIMEERKAKRRMRREAAAARAAAQYSTSWSVKSSEARSSPNLSPASSDTSGVASGSGSSSAGSAPGSPQTPSASSNSASDIFNPELEPVTA